MWPYLLLMAIGPFEGFSAHATLVIINFEYHLSLLRGVTG